MKIMSSQAVILTLLKYQNDILKVLKIQAVVTSLCVMYALSNIWKKHVQK